MLQEPFLRRIQLQICLSLSKPRVRYLFLPRHRVSHCSLGQLGTHSKPLPQLSKSWDYWHEPQGLSFNMPNAGRGEREQSPKCLLCKHEDLSSIYTMTERSRAWWCSARSPVLLYAGQSSGFSERGSVSKKSCAKTEEFFCMALGLHITHTHPTMEVPFAATIEKGSQFLYRVRRAAWFNKTFSNGGNDLHLSIQDACRGALTMSLVFLKNQISSFIGSN